MSRSISYRSAIAWIDGLVPVSVQRDERLGERHRRIGDEQVGVDLLLGAEARAARTGAVRRVEGEDARLELRQRDAVLGAGEALGEGQLLLLVEQVDDDEALGEVDRGLDGLEEPAAELGLHPETVDHDLDRVLELLVERDLVLEEALLAVHLHAGEAVAAELVQEVLVLALPVADDGCVDREARALGELQDLIHDCLDRLAGDGPAADRTVRAADARVEQAQVVVDLRDRAHRGPRVSGGRLLVDRDRRAQAVDRVHVRLLHHLEELAGVRRERLHVAALALGVDRVEGKARLPGAREAGDADQLVPRKADSDVLEVVLAGTVNDEFVLGHNRPV